MVAIELRFPAARYHATPWGRHVNEGEVEWPPSPWRLIRALIATWYHKASDDVEETVMRRLVDKLCAELPQYGLPAVASGHTRHYMPLYNSARDDKTARVFDAFLHIDPSTPLSVTWLHVDLKSDERHALSLLLERIGYLGRAESWVEASLGELGRPPLCRPVGVDDSIARDGDVVRLLVPQGSQAFLEWRGTLTAGNGNGKAWKRGNKSGVDVPPDLFGALQADIGQVRKAGWSQPPGSRFVEYVRPHLEQVKIGVRRAKTVGSTVARYAVTSAVLPSLRDALSLAYRVHQALVKRSNGHPVFTGKGDDDRVLIGHGHVHIFCEANGADGRAISHVTLYAPMGFDEAAESALAGLQHVWGHGGHPVNLVLLGVGNPVDFAGPNIRAGQCPLFVESRVWVSRTPFVPTRHPKRKLDASGMQVGGPEHDLYRLLREQGFPEPKRVERLPDTSLGGHRTTWIEFRTVRHHGNGQRAGNRGWGFRVEFEDLERGPLAVGYGAHFGLGMFVPEPAYDF